MRDVSPELRRGLMVTRHTGQGLSSCSGFIGYPPRVLEVLELRASLASFLLCALGDGF